MGTRGSNYGKNNLILKFGIVKLLMKCCFDFVENNDAWSVSLENILENFNVFPGVLILVTDGHIDCAFLFDGFSFLFKEYKNV